MKQQEREEGEGEGEGEEREREWRNGADQGSVLRLVSLYKVLSQHLINLCLHEEVLRMREGGIDVLRG